MENQQIDPWKSFEVKDYEQLAKNFGIESLKSIKIPVDNLYFSRGIIFGHKDLNNIFKAKKEGKPFTMMTGLMPSGKFHFGHKIIADLMIYFQELGAECYIAVADIEAYLTRNVSLEDAKKIAIEEYLSNYIALGLKPNKTKFYFQTTGTKEYMNFSKLISKRTTFNELQGIYGELAPGKIISAFNQVADILQPQFKENGGPKPVVVPVGIDQLPHINLARDVAGRMKEEYNFIPTSAVFTKFMKGLKGGKMSSSDPTSYIALTDSPEEAEKKIKKYAFSGGQATIEEHRRKGGNPEIDIPFQFLKYGLEPNDKKLNEIYKNYKSGNLLTGELKAIVIDKMKLFLNEHQERKERAMKNLDKFLL